MSCQPKPLNYVKIIHEPNEGWEASALITHCQLFFWREGWSEKEEYRGVGLQYLYKHRPVLISFNLTFYLISCMANAGGSFFHCNIVDK